MSIFRPFANKLVILIIVAVGLILTSNYNTVFKSKNCNSRSRYSKKGNIQKLKAGSLLRKIESNINITFAELFPKLCKRPRKANV